MEQPEISYSGIQQWMQDMVMLPAGQGGIPVEAVVNASTRLNAARHLDIYRRSYIARLRECMRNQFTALAHALGAELFDAFANQYLAAYPSKSYTLNTLGSQFAAFLQATRPDAEAAEKESWPDFMIELAGFEYALSEIFDEYSAVQAQAATADTPDAELTISPVLHLFEHSYPVCRYYLDVAQKKEPELPLPGPAYCAVTRVHYRLGLFELRPAQYQFLQILKTGARVPEALAILAGRHQFTDAEVKRVWPQWRDYFTASGILCG